MQILDEMLSAVDSSVDDLISLHQSLVRIESVNTGVMPTGNETAVCEFVQQWLSEEGIDSEILARDPNRGNIIANINGTSGQAGLMFMSHTDVVPVEDESKWSFPPFGATISNGRIYGRGSNDCKGLLAAQMMAMRLLKRTGVQLQDGLILASGADEEHGGRYGFEWLTENYPEKLAAPLAVNEGGGEPISSGSLTYLLGTGEKGRLQIEINVKGTSAHASVPWQGSNAMYRVAQVLQRIEAYQPELDTSSELFNHLSTFAIEHKPSPDNITEIISDMESVNPRFASVLRALSRMTVTPTMVSGGIKSNSVPESVSITCDVRTLPHQDDQYVRTELTEALAGIPDVDFEIDYMAVPNSSPFQTDFADRIRSVTERVLNREIKWVPMTSTGFTDSRFTRTLDTTTYGFAGSHPDDDPLLSNIHGTDESIGINSLISGTKIMLALSYDVLASP